MNVFLVSIIGPDRKGIVASISSILLQHGGNWLESRLSRLAGSFAGIIRIQLDSSKAFDFQESLKKTLSDYTFEMISGLAEDGPAEGQHAQMFLSGVDNPGIVQKVFKVLEKHHANVEELKSGVRGAPWSGQGIFESEARLKLSAETERNELVEALEALSMDLMVEIKLD